MKIINSIYFILPCYLFVQIFCTEKPKISIDFVRYADNYKWIKESPGNSDSYIKYAEDEYMISLNTVGLDIVCKASYPVYWKLDLNAEDDSYTMMYDIFSYQEREVPIDKFYDQSAYKYSSSVVIQMVYKQFTGNYTCISALDKKVQKSVYFFFENVAPPYLAQAGKTLNISAYNKDSIILPCNVYNQDVLVYLFQQITHTGVPYNTSDWIEVPISNSVSYDPKIGFTLKVQDLSEILGRYKCATNETEDFLLIDVLKERSNDSPDVFESNKLEGSAKYYWNSKNKKFYCCSNNKDSPPTMTMSYCENQAFCQQQREILSTVSHNASVEIFMARPSRSSGNCSSRRLWGDTNYVMKCQGEGISLLTDLHYKLKPKNHTVENKGRSPVGLDLDLDFDMRTNWEPTSSLDSEIIVQVIPPYMIDRYENEDPVELTAMPNSTTEVVQRENGKQVFYVGEKVIFYCLFSQYYFSRGNMWAFKMKNGTINIIYNVTTHWKQYSPDEFYPYRRDGSRVEMILTMEKDIQSVICYAPVSKSSDWASASVSFETKEPTLPTIQGKNLETVYWTLNETNMILQCTTGVILPRPSFVWTKDGSVISTDNKTYTVTKGNQTTSLKVHLVSHDIHGQYVCSATNVAGNTNRTFNVFVAERHSLGLIIGGSASVILFLAALISFLFWKMKNQTNSLVNLRANVYAGH